MHKVGTNGILNSYFPLSDAFASPFGDMPNLARKINELHDSCSDVSLLGSFSENHDVPRFPTKSDDMPLVKNVLAFTFLGGGIPVIYQGQEQHFQGTGGNDPYNREALWSSGYDRDHELYKYIARLNQYRRRFMINDAAFLSSRTDVLFVDSHTLTVKRADLLMTLSNKGSYGGNSSISVQSGYEPGSTVIELLTCITQVVKPGGTIDVLIGKGQPNFHIPSSAIGTEC
jgi:alpha-amylase